MNLRPSTPIKMNFKSSTTFNYHKIQMSRISIASCRTVSPSSRHLNFTCTKPTFLPIQAISTTTTTTMSSNNHHPSFEVIGGGKDTLILPLEKTLEKPYNTFPVIGWNRHLETIFASFFRHLPDVDFHREIIGTKDGGSVALDWGSSDKDNLPPDAPLLILLHGLSGGSQDPYVRHMLVRARSKGWRVVVFNSRGCADSPVTTPQLHSASFLGDITEVVAHVSNLYPNANLYGVGWSIGANILVQYLGQEGVSCPLSGAVSLCNPFNLVFADEEFRKGFNNVYDKSIARALSGIFTKHTRLFENVKGDYNISLAANAKTVREYDDGLTRVSFGFKSVDEYYSKSNSSDSVKFVRTPLLCIQADNDPIAPSRAIPRQDIEENGNCILIITPTGGHLGWVAGSEAPFGAPWTDPLVMDFLEYLQKEKSQNVEASTDMQTSKSA